MSLLSKTTALSLLSLAVLVAGALPASATNVTVTLKVHATVTFPFNEPAFTTDGLTTCNVSVATGAHGAAVLNQAVTNGCIDGWDYANVGGTFLTSVKGHGQADATDGRNTFSTTWPCVPNSLDPAQAGIVASSWVFLLNGAGASTGLDQYAASSGDVLEFVYVVDTCTFANALAVSLTGIHVDSPVLLQGNALTDPGNL